MTQQTNKTIWVLFSSVPYNGTFKVELDTLFEKFPSRDTLMLKGVPYSSTDDLLTHHSCAIDRNGFTMFYDLEERVLN